MRYNSPNTPMDSMRDFVTRGGIPVTMTLLCVSVLLFLVSFFTQGKFDLFLFQNVAFEPENMAHAPWTFLTYPVYNGNSINLLVIINAFFFWLAGGSLERSWGSTRYATFFFALTAITACSLELGWFLSGRGALPPLMGYNWPLAGLIVAFCMLNPELTLMFFFYPIKAKYLALLVTLMTYFTAGPNPLMNLFACGGILAAFLYVRYARPWGTVDSYGARPRVASRGPDLRAYPSASRFTTRPRTTMDGSPARRSILDFAGRWKDYQERKRLAKLWKNSGFSDPEREQQDDEGRRR